MPLVPSCAAAAEWRAHSARQQAAGGLQLAAANWSRPLHKVRLISSSVGRWARCCCRLAAVLLHQEGAAAAPAHVKPACHGCSWRLQLEAVRMQHG